MTHTVYVLFQFLVGVHGNVLGEILIPFYRTEEMVSSILRVFSARHEIVEYLGLHCLSIVEMPLQFMLTGTEEQLFCYVSQTHYYTILYLHRNIECQTAHHRKRCYRWMNTFCKDNANRTQ